MENSEEAPKLSPNFSCLPASIAAPDHPQTWEASGRRVTLLAFTNHDSSPGFPAQHSHPDPAPNYPGSKYKGEKMCAGSETIAICHTLV